MKMLESLIVPSSHIQTGNQRSISKEIETIELLVVLVRMTIIQDKAYVSTEVLLILAENYVNIMMLDKRVNRLAIIQHFESSVTKLYSAVQEIWLSGAAIVHDWRTAAE